MPFDDYFLITIFTTVAILFVIAIIKEKRRRELWEAIAAEMGFKFYRNSDEVIERLGTLKTFSRGHNKEAKNVLWGKDGDITVIITDYQYKTGSDKESTQFETICILESSRLNLPHCFMRRQGLFDSLGKFFGGHDIDFTSDAEFSRSFVLQGEDETAIRKLFGKRAREEFCFLVEKLEKMGMGRFMFEADFDILVINMGKRIPPEDSHEVMNIAFDILNTFEK